jgi:NADPH2:quinone reductase
MFNSPPEEQRVAAEAINRAFENSQWHPHVGRVFPLEQAAEAHRLQEENTLHKQGTLAGTIVLVP